VLVAVAGRQALFGPRRKRVRARGGDTQAHALRGLGQLAAAADDLLGQLADVGADLGADLDDRLVQLALDLIAERRRARRQQLRHVRAKLPGVRIDDVEFLFHAERERLAHGRCSDRYHSPAIAPDAQKASTTATTKGQSAGAADWTGAIRAMTCVRVTPYADQLPPPAPAFCS